VQIIYICMQACVCRLSNMACEQDGYYKTGPSHVLQVFIALLYTHTMPNIYYCSTCILVYPHLMAKHCLRVGRKSRFFPKLVCAVYPTWPVNRTAIIRRDLHMCCKCSLHYYTPIQCQTSTIVAPACCYTPT